MVTPLVKHKIVKKRTAKFTRFQSDRKVTVKVRRCERSGDGGAAFRSRRGHPNVVFFSS